jgi:hypothetical protein
MRGSRGKAGVIGAALALSAGMAVVCAPSAAAAPAEQPGTAACSWFWADRDPGSAQVVNRVDGYPGIALRDGPWSYCNVLHRVPWGHWVVLDCYISDGQEVNGVKSWSHVRYSNGGPVYSGWISDHHLSGLGSNYRC